MAKPPVSNAEMRARFHVYILQTTVLTEVNRVAPELASRLILALDESDKWWKDGEKLSIAGWIYRVASRKLERVP